MSNTKRSSGYRLRLSPEESDKLNYCSSHYKLKTSKLLRMLIDNCYESIHKNDDEMDIQNDEMDIQNDEMDIQDYDFEEFDEYFPR